MSAAWLFAAGADAAGEGGAPPPASQSVTVNLINRLVALGVLSRADAADLLRQAEEEAAAARERAEASDRALVETAAVARAAAEAAEARTSAGVARVDAVPKAVEEAMRERIKREVLEELDGGAGGGGLRMPDWITKVDPFLDFRFRFEGLFFGSGNDNTGVVPDFNAINTGSPFDLASGDLPPQINVEEDRYRFRIRMRFGAEADLGEGFTMGMRVGTGETNSPVTLNQSLGAASGQGGQFSKYALWLDRAFVKHQAGAGRDRALAVLVGRFDSPFFTASQVLWDDELGFDGAAITGRYRVFDNLTPFFAAGAFPVFNTAFNFSTNRGDKFESYDKYLYAGQLGAEWGIAEDFKLTVAGSYARFQNIEGELSDPYAPRGSSDAGNTDASRPSFAQRGNTYRALRNIVADAGNGFGARDQWQYFGLATPFEVLSFSGKVEYAGFDPVVVSVYGEWHRNLAFDAAEVGRVAVNNRVFTGGGVPGTAGAFEGDDTAWIVGAQVGSGALVKRGDWNLQASYRRVGSDAVVDGFAESDFGGGGTNVKGFSIGGTVAISANVWLGIRWMSAESIAGPPLESDIVQMDLGARF